MSHILVIGASSGIGLAAVKAGLRAGHQVRAFARTADSINIVDEKLEKFSGDALVAEDVNAALSGIDAVIQSLGIPMNLQMFTGPVTLFSQSTELLLPAMKKIGVKRLIAVTGFGAGTSRSSISPLQRPGFNLVFGRAYSDKDIQERMIRESGLDWTIVRPGVLTNGQLTKRYKVLTEPRDWRNGIISRADVADFLIRQVGHEPLTGQSPVLIG